MGPQNSKQSLYLSELSGLPYDIYEHNFKYDGMNVEHNEVQQWYMPLSFMVIIINKIQQH